MPRIETPPDSNDEAGPENEDANEDSDDLKEEPESPLASWDAIHPEPEEPAHEEHEENHDHEGGAANHEDAGLHWVESKQGHSGSVSLRVSVSVWRGEGRLLLRHDRGHVQKLIETSGLPGQGA